MNRTRKPVRALTAADVMSRALVTVHHRTTLRAAAKALTWWGGHVLPVTDDQDRLVGVLTAADLLRWALDARPGGGQGHDTTAWTDWRVMAPGAGRTDEVRWHLKADPVVAALDTPLPELVRRMRGRRSCWAVVTDGRERPAGIVSAAELLAASGPASAPAERSPAPAPSAGGRPHARRLVNSPVG